MARRIKISVEIHPLLLLVAGVLGLLRLDGVIHWPWWVISLPVSGPIVLGWAVWGIFGKGGK